MRFAAFLLLPALALAAPVPKPNDPPPYEVTLAAKDQLVLDVTIHNNGKEPLKIPYRVTPWEHITIELRGESGKNHTIRHTGDEEPGKPGTLTIEAGKSHTLSIHTCHSLPQLGEPQQVTFQASWKHGSRVIVSDPLTVKP